MNTLDHGCYDASQFDPSAIEDKITKDDVEYAFHCLHKSDYWVPAVNTSNTGSQYCCFMVIIFLMTLVSFVFGIVSGALIPIDLIVFPFILLLFLAAPFCCIKGAHLVTGVSYLKNREDDFNSILGELNKTRFKESKFKFVAGEKGAWIELRADRRYPKLGMLHREIEAKTMHEINEQLDDQLYAAGLVLCLNKSFDKEFDDDSD